MTPTAFFVTRGIGYHRKELESFEAALRDAQIQMYNLVTVSSILPPNVLELSIEAGNEHLNPGQIVHCVMSRINTNEPQRLINASVGIAKPAHNGQYGYISEHHSFGERSSEAGEYAEDMAASMLATTFGIPFDVDQAWNEKKQIFETSGGIIETRNITATCKGKEGFWATAVAAVVFVF